MTTPINTNGVSSGQSASVPHEFGLIASSMPSVPASGYDSVFPLPSVNGNQSQAGPNAASTVMSFQIPLGPLSMYAQPGMGGLASSDRFVTTN
jgi:hypothetical protein